MTLARLNQPAFFFRLLDMLRTEKEGAPIREEAALIMGRLGHGLNARLAKPDLPPDVLGSTTLLLAQLEPAREEALLKDYLSRRRRDLHDRLAAFAPEGRDAGDGEGDGEGEGEGGGAAGGAAEGGAGGAGAARASSRLRRLVQEHADVG